MAKRLSIIVAAALSLCACIKNDLPNPVVDLYIASLEVEGVGGDIVLDRSTYTATIPLAEETNIEAVQFKSISFGADVVTNINYEADAEKIIANGVKYYVEVSNMPTTNEAIAMLKAAGVIIAPSKAVNAGGVSVSGLEMSQNSMRYSWTAEEVDEKLKMIMKNIFEASVSAANKYGLGDDLVAGANIAGFLKVADAMKAQGVC
jgi:hypothetical protein